MEWLNLYIFHRNDRVRHINQNSMFGGTYFQNRRWQLVTFLEKMSGFWPHQSKLQQYPLQLFYFSLCLIGWSATANKLSEHAGIDDNMTIECCLFMIFMFGVFVKFFFASIQQSSRRKFYERIAKHFETMSDPEEAAVLNQGAEEGFKYTVYYMCGMSLGIVIFDGVPVFQAFYKYIFNNHELEVQLPMPMNFGFDHRKYWYIIAIHSTIWICSNTVIDFAYDLSFMLQVRHAKALFKIVGMRLRKASELADKTENETVSDEDAEESYSLISSAIDLHSECFEVVKQIEECSTMSWFIILLLSTGGFGAGLHLLTTKFHEPMETLRYAAMFMIVLLHFQVIFSQGQMIIDSNSSIADKCYELKWYRLPKKSHKLLTTIMVRTSIPCQLTGAKLFPLSMETFSKMLKAGLSYYTVFEGNGE